MNDKIKVFSTPWHISHQYELLKIPNLEFYYLINHTRKWSEQARPMPENLNWVPYYEKGKYDFALLHIDQQCLLEPKLGKRRLFDDMRSVITDIPIIVINHGSICYPEMFPTMYQREVARSKGIDMEDKENRERIDAIPSSIKDGEEWAKKEIRKLLDGVAEMVVNSCQAQREWGWGKAIIHGLDPDEWWDLPKEPRATTFISPGGMGSKYYGRHLYGNVRATLREKYGITHVWILEEKPVNSWDDYRNFLGRSLVYFNPTYGSPMPRCRTEAMLSGCCIVTTRHHDITKYIKDGVNGFIIVDDPEEVAKKIAWCIDNYKETVKIGERGRETAIKEFHISRYQNDWKDLIKNVLGKEIF